MPCRMFKVFAMNGLTHTVFTAFSGKEFSRTLQGYMMNPEAKSSLRVRDIPCLVLPSGPHAQSLSDSTWLLSEVTVDKTRSITVEEWSGEAMVEHINAAILATNLKVFPDAEFVAVSYMPDGMPVLARKNKRNMRK